MVSNSNASERMLADAVAAGAAPGLVAVVADRDATLNVAAAGVLGIEDGSPMSPDAVFWLASCTKLVTSIAALQCIERGALTLDDPLGSLVQAADDLQVLDGFDGTGRPLLRKPRNAVTLRHLLTHTSGLGYDLMSGPLLRFHGDKGPPPPGQLSSLKGPLLFDPGEGWTYGVSTDWVGRVVEAVSGTTLDAYCREEIFTPLGLRDTGFAPLAGRPRAMLHQRAADGDFVQIPCPCDDTADWEYRSGGGGLFGTAADFIRLLRMVLRLGELDGARILRPATAQLLFGNAVNGHRAGALPSIVPTVNAPFDLFANQHSGWSLAGLINPADVPGGRLAGSLSWAGIANTHYWIDPGAGICAALMAQYLPFADPAMMGVLRSFEQAVYRSTAMARSDHGLLYPLGEGAAC
jgi:methyl acetate hydrolase